MTTAVSHDQNFKNQILDYPIEAIRFYAPEEAQALEQNPKILPIRQEQLKEQLGDSFRALDTPILLEWPNGEREALLFVIEEETQSSRFSIRRLIKYCLDITELYQTDRMVPVTIFTSSAPNAPMQLKLGGDRHTYLDFHYIKCALKELDATEHYQSDNIVARMNLPLMRYPDNQKLEVFHHAIQGLITLERDPDKQAKYADWVDIYAHLDDNEINEYEQRYPEEKLIMAGFAERYLTQGREEGREEGLVKGEAQTLLKLIKLKFREHPDWVEAKLNDAKTDQLDRWVAGILSANSLDELFTN